MSVAALLALGSGVTGQEPAEPPPTNTPYTLKVERNEVPVRVIVRGRDKQPVRNLTRDDFQILDNGKRQVITQFSSEETATEARPGAEEAGPSAPGTKPAAAEFPRRFVALYFDDLVMDFEAISRTRTAAEKYLQNSLERTDRVALYTSSGEISQEFTADRDKIEATLQRLHPVGIFNNVGNQCPDLSDYEAYLIVEKGNMPALNLATLKVIECMCHGDAQTCPSPGVYATVAASRRWARAEMQQDYSLHGLGELVRRLSVLPGRRSVVFVSSGFLIGENNDTISQIINRALRAGVVVNSLDARGLFTLIPGGDASQRGLVISPSMTAQRVAMKSEGAHQDASVLEQVADGTGGTFFHDNNDFDAGFRAAGGLAEYAYLLTFSPSNLKANGKYHKLKVKLVGDARKRHLTVQARRGYFAAKGSNGPAEQALVEITDAVYSRVEINKARLHVLTQYFITSGQKAQVRVSALLDTQGLAFRDESGRHVADLTFVTAVFDNNGGFIQGLRKDVKLRLRDRTLEYLRSDGLSIASDFKLPPGKYLVRAVVRNEVGEISSANSSLEIPD